jgi:hypothetical protein
MGNSAAMREVKGLAPALPGLKYGVKRVSLKGAPKVPQHVRKMTTKANKTGRS